MLKTEELTENGISKTKTYSDSGKQIRKIVEHPIFGNLPTNELYDEAVDISPISGFFYVEVGSDEEKEFIGEPTEAPQA